AELAFSGEKPEVTEGADGREVTADSIVEAIETQWPAQQSPEGFAFQREQGSGRKSAERQL
ncbi:hypothetical protein, partial [Brevibacterium paucivorans]|uniref:hypothetical protein n=1 Tax=Brevibacterium paucivorans TaxID=170994 RepID=UPI001CA545E7